LKALASITAPMKFWKSVGSPTLISDTWASSPSRTCGHSEAGMNARDAAEHFCPWNSKAPRTRAVTSAGTWAEAWAKMKSFPPSQPTMRG
jgi:hypothetical protein